MAAGMGTRFGGYTELFPKGFVKVAGKSMIERSLDILLSCGMQRIVIGTGYRSEVYEGLMDVYPQVECCYSPRYAETNSMYTLYNMREAIGTDDFLLLESDLIFERKAIESLQECPQQDVMLVTPVTKFQDQYYVEYDREHHLYDCSVNPEKVNAKGELVGIHKLSNLFYQKMCADYASIVAGQPKLGYEYELLRMSRSISPVYVLKVDDLKWYEIDDENDLAYAEKNIVKYCI
jgi:choline kinase